MSKCPLPTEPINDMTIAIPPCSIRYEHHRVDGLPELQHSLRVGCLFSGFAVGTPRQTLGRYELRAYRLSSVEQPTSIFLLGSKLPELPNPRTTVPPTSCLDLPRLSSSDCGAGVSRHVLRASAAGVLSQSSIIELLACQNCMQQHSLRVGCLFGGFAVGTLRQAARSVLDSSRLDLFPRFEVRSLLSSRIPELQQRLWRRRRQSPHVRALRVAGGP